MILVARPDRHKTNRRFSGGVGSGILSASPKMLPPTERDADMADELQGQARKLEHLRLVKLQLAARTDRKVKTTHSKPARERLVRRAARFRRQATEVARRRDAVVAAKKA